VTAPVRGCAGRFLAWEMPSGSTVVDLLEESVILPMVAGVLRTYAGYAVGWCWSAAAAAWEVAP
jgi:hypothetical protein